MECWRCGKRINNYPENASQWMVEATDKIVIVHNACWQTLNKKAAKKHGFKPGS